MSQKLIVPFVKSMMLCGWKNARYAEAWGYPHYGIDISSIQGNAGSNHSIFASGVGTVLAAGKDDSLGYGVAILYKGCVSNKGTAETDLVARYMHMVSINVKAGDTVTVETKIGTEGKEGTEDYHLHLEFDTDTTPKYATWSPQVSKGHTFWKKGTDSTINPSLWLWQDEGRILVTPTYNPAWLNDVDKNIPTLVSKKETTPIAYDEDECEDYYGEPAYYVYDKDVGGYRLFDKWWRKIPSETFPTAGEYATAAQQKKAKAWTSDINEKYKEANDPEGKAGIEAADGSDQTTVDTGTVLDYVNEAIDILNKIKAML